MDVELERVWDRARRSRPDPGPALHKTSARKVLQEACSLFTKPELACSAIEAFVHRYNDLSPKQAHLFTQVR